MFFILKYLSGQDICGVIEHVLIPVGLRSYTVTFTQKAHRTLVGLCLSFKSASVYIWVLSWIIYIRWLMLWFILCAYVNCVFLFSILRCIWMQRNSVEIVRNIFFNLLLWHKFCLLSNKFININLWLWPLLLWKSLTWAGDKNCWSVNGCWWGFLRGNTCYIHCCQVLPKSCDIRVLPM